MACLCAWDVALSSSIALALPPDRTSRLSQANSLTQAGMHSGD
ncbi:MAG: hypothetical protein ACFE9C_08065 [Candidatus Hodarchaeota archaeon]